MRASELKAKVESANEDSKFFSRGNMRFAGDTMSNFGVRGPLPFVTHLGDRIQVYELYRRRPVKEGLRSSAYFNADTFRQTHGKLVEPESNLNKG